ncbi:PI-PLC X domain-containing protein-like [Heracleum sosnowskyi]|uniref:PI-PLC X domain-containing protein-like n=1 Tax=Heracleum sosnowskyi TaxID=360622 RepID=A0AAD8N6Y0_9APIA|nr:PI-PLC X domain-containing protein-like [Heracleum sosnowskyi]
MQVTIFHLTQLVFITATLISYSSSLKIGETCSASSKCDSGYLCSTCPINGNTRPRCTRLQPLNPTSKVKGLPFNRYSWLTTHNSFSIARAVSDTGSIVLAPRNQEDSNGVRGLNLDMYDFNNDIWLCHSFGGKCLNVTSFRPASKTLKGIQVFLEKNPTEIVTIFIEDYVTSPKGLTKVFKASGLDKYMFHVSRMPTNGSDWPTGDDMVQKNQRLVVFTSKSSKEASEGIAYEWKYVVENQFKAGEALSVPVEDGHLTHVFQVALGDVKNPKAANYVPVRMKVEDKKFVIGTLSADKGPQISFDLVLDKDFELS